MLSRLLFPYQCLLCKSRSDQKRDLCSYCEKSFLGSKACCRQCGLWLEEVELEICGHCLSFPPAFDRVITALDYTPKSAYLLHRFKFHHCFVDGRILADLLAKTLQASYRGLAWPDVIVPVPLHHKRLLSRGFNQALVLAKDLKLPIKIDYRLVRRIRHSPRQVGLSGKLRRRNLRRAFKLARPVAGLHIALLDDVITTGSTLQAIAHQLKKAGARQVDIWSALRTQNHVKI